MSKDIAISVQHVSKHFKLPHERHSSLKQRVLSFSKPTYDEFHALRDISFEVKRGEFFGIVGRNGSGKSTMLKIIGGIYQPSDGKVLINGTLTPFIELGIGFNPELTGRENVYLNGAILGLTRKEVQAKYNEIVDFAELHKFMDQKLKNYSSGMQVRLAFSIAIQAHNDILLIDEVLAVGDSAFQKKCFDVFKGMKKSGKTVIFVTHDMSAVEEFCERAMLIEKGVVATSGKSSDVANAYRKMMLESSETVTGDAKRWGTGAATITDTVVTNTANKPLKKLDDAAAEFMVHVTVQCNQALVRPIFGLTVRNAEGTNLLITNTKATQTRTGEYKAGDKVTVTWKLPNVFNNGTVSFSPAVASEDTRDMYEWVDDMLFVPVKKDYYLPGVLHVHQQVTIHQ